MPCHERSGSSRSSYESARRRRWTQRRPRRANPQARERRRCSGHARSSEGSKEVDEVLLLLLGVADRVTAIVEIHEFTKRRGRAIREIRCPCGWPAELLHDDRAHIVALPRDERSP